MIFTSLFPEPCTKSAAETIMSLRHEIKGYISFHAFSQLWLTPWAYTKRLPEDYDVSENLPLEQSKRYSRQIQMVTGKQT